MMKTRAEAAALLRAMNDRNNNQPPMPGVYPDYAAPLVIVLEDGSREMRDMRWGMPTSKQALFKAATQRGNKLQAKGTEFDFAELLKLEPDKGTTNVRNTTNAQGKTNAHWRSLARGCEPVPCAHLRRLASDVGVGRSGHRGGDRAVGDRRLTTPIEFQKVRLPDSGRRCAIS